MKFYVNVLSNLKQLKFSVLSCISNYKIINFTNCETFRDGPKEPSKSMDTDCSEGVINVGFYCFLTLLGIQCRFALDQFRWKIFLLFGSDGVLFV